MHPLILILSLLLLPPSEVEVSDVLVQVENIAPAQGNLHIDIYKGEEKFMFKEHAFKNNKVLVQSSNLEFTIKGLPKGEYAICVWHDANQNGYMDKNLLGIPKEGYGFSNNPACIVGPPKFRHCVVDTNKMGLVKIRMNN